MGTGVPPDPPPRTSEHFLPEARPPGKKGKKTALTTPTITKGKTTALTTPAITKGKKTSLATPAKPKRAKAISMLEDKRVIRMEDTITVADLARNMGIGVPDFLKMLWDMGLPGVNINTAIDFDLAQILASEFDYEVQNVAFKVAKLTGDLDQGETKDEDENDDEDVDAIWLAVADVWSRGLDELRALKLDLALLKETLQLGE